MVADAVDPVWERRALHEGPGIQMRNPVEAKEMKDAQLFYPGAVITSAEKQETFPAKMRFDL